MVRICVVDGQGGGIGSAVIRRLREAYGETIEILALGTNAIATSAMLKAGANRGATGENAVIRTVNDCQIIVGSIAIIMAHAMMGELTSAMAEAVSSASAVKILIPVSQERIRLLGVVGQPLPHMIDDLLKVIRTEMEELHV
jgi:hypothetical protein